MTNPAGNQRLEKKSTIMVGVVILVIAAWNYWQGRLLVTSITAGAGGLLVLLGLSSAWASRKFYVGWMALAGALGYVNSRILLGLMFYLMITPYGYVMRLFGRDVLRRREPKQESYWISRTHTRQAREQYERLF